jgi:transcriptional regulator with XRE-family HTH domain
LYARKRPEERSTKDRGVRIDPDRFRFELARRGLTAKELSRRSGITEACIARARRGTMPLEVDTLRRLGEVLAAQPVLVGVDLLLGPVNATGVAAITPPRRNEEARASGIPA